MGMKRKMRELMTDMDLAEPVAPYFEDQRHRDGTDNLIIAFRKKLDRFQEQISGLPVSARSPAAPAGNARQLAGPG